MRKILFHFALSIMVLALSIPAEAQKPKKVPTIGYLLASFPPSPSAPLNRNVDSFLQGLRDLGYVEGKNLAIEYRWAAGKSDQRLLEMASELVGLKVDVIVTTNTPATLAAKRASTTIPIVMVGPGDPVGTGLVASLAHPGGNVTGLSLVTTELTGKRLELLKEAFPTVSRVAVLWNSADSAMTLRVKQAELVSPVLGLIIQRVGVQDTFDFEKAFSAMSNKATDALLVVMDPFTSFHQRRILDFAANNQLPAMYERTDLVNAGGLMSYGPPRNEIYRRAAYYVDRILKGAKPGDLPVEQPTKFEFVINLKTAKQIGVTIPQKVLARADKVIK
jgi:putative tryptophan/tyrosine transport system substrate-binding protein